MNDTSTRSLSSGPTLAAIMAVGVLGISGFLVLPSIIGGLVSDLGYDDAQVGLISTWQLVGLGLGSIALVPLLKIIDWRRAVTICLAVLIIGELLSGAFTASDNLVAMRFVAGFGGGLSVSLAAYLIAQTEQADRNFGFFLAAQVVFAIAANNLFPLLTAEYGVRAVFISIAILCALTAIVAPRLVPAQRWVAAEQGEGNDRKRWIYVLIVFAGIFCFFTAIGAIWTYIAPIGMAAGLSQQQAGTAISIGLVGALIGANAPAILPARLGRVLPMVVALVLQVTAVALLYRGIGNASFIVAAVLFCLGWYASVPYQFGLLAAVDKDGRPAMLLNGVAGLGSGLGPAIVAGAVSSQPAKLYVIGVSLLVVAVLCHSTVVWIRRKAKPI